MNLPNKITLSRIFLVPIFMIFIIPIPTAIISSTYLGFINPQLVYINNFILLNGNYIGAIIFISAAVTDKIDGYIARSRNQITKLGIFLDPIADKLIVSAALIALVQRNNITGWVAMIIIAREFIVTAFRLVASAEGIVLTADKWGKLKMLMQSIAISLSLLNNYPLSKVSNFQFDKFAMLIAVLITCFSGYNYISKNWDIVSTLK